MGSGDGARRLLDYEEVLEQLPDGRVHLLLGNGFSIACDPVFSYESLYERAREAGLSERAEAVFERLGTNNFEGAMRLLDDTHWVAQTYGLVEGGESEMLEDVERLKTAVVQAVSDSHLAHTGEVPDERKEAALEFLQTYHNVFTVNYDLLLYWVNMSAEDPPFQDGFRADPDDHDSPYLVFHERMGRHPGVYYIHGALHLYRAAGELRKHSWVRTGERLTEQIREGLNERQYPVFVAEGKPEKKLEQIRQDGYLSYCLGKLGRIGSDLVVLGHALGYSDRHIVDTIAENTRIPNLFVGIYGSPDDPANRATISSAEAIRDRRREIAERTRANELDLYFFDSESVNVWG